MHRLVVTRDRKYTNFVEVRGGRGDTFVNVGGLPDAEHVKMAADGNGGNPRAVLRIHLQADRDNKRGELPNTLQTRVKKDGGEGAQSWG